MKTAAEAVLDYLDGATHGMNLTGLVQTLTAYTVDELKEATASLYADGKINRISVKGTNDRYYYVFYSLYLCTVSFADPLNRPAPKPANSLLSDDQALRVMARLEQELAQPKINPVEVGKPLPFLYAVPDAPEPEVREVVKEVIKYREPRYGIMDVIDRWKLNFRLSRIIEIVGSARNRKLTKEDADTVSRMIQQHVKEAANG